MIKKCFRCGYEDIEVFDGKEIIVFRCKLCSQKWGNYNNFK